MVRAVGRITVGYSEELIRRSVRDTRGRYAKMPVQAIVLIRRIIGFDWARQLRFVDPTVDRNGLEALE